MVLVSQKSSNTYLNLDERDNLVMVNVDCLLDKIYNHLGDGPPGVPEDDCLDCVS